MRWWSHSADREALPLTGADGISGSCRYPPGRPTAARQYSAGTLILVVLRSVGCAGGSLIAGSADLHLNSGRSRQVSPSVAPPLRFASLKRLAVIRCRLYYYL